MSSVYLAFQSPNLFVIIFYFNIQQSSYRPSSRLPHMHHKILPNTRRKPASPSIHNHHRQPPARLSNIKYQMETPTTTHSLHYPLSATQRLPKSAYSNTAHTTNKAINCQKLLKHMISRCLQKPFLLPSPSTRNSLPSLHLWQQQSHL